MTNYPFTIHNLYSSDQRNIQRLIYDMNMDKYGYFYGVMEVLPLILPITQEEDEVEDLNDLITMMSTPEGEVVIVDNETSEPYFYNIDISRIEMNYDEEKKIVKVFFKATKDDRTSNPD